MPEPPRRPASLRRNSRPLKTSPFRCPRRKKGLWLLSDLNEDSNRSYHLSVTLSFQGKLDVEALAGALAQVVARHGALRTTISANGESQTIHAHLPPEILHFDYSAMSQEERSKVLSQKMWEFENELFPELQGPFLAESAPLMSMPLSPPGERFTRIVPISSPWCSSTVRTWIFPPSATITSSRAERVGFMPSESSTRFASSEEKQRRTEEERGGGEIAGYGCVDGR